MPVIRAKKEKDLYRFPEKITFVETPINSSPNVNQENNLTTKWQFFTIWKKRIIDFFQNV